jgi:hypothetical protein
VGGHRAWGDSQNTGLAGVRAKSLYLFTPDQLTFPTAKKDVSEEDVG